MGIKRQSFLALRSYMAHMSPAKQHFAFSSVLFGISNILIAVLPVFIGLLIGALTENRDPWIFVIVLVACSSVHDILWRVAEIYYLKYIFPLTFTYENLLFKQVIQKPFHYFTDKFTGKISSYVTNLSNEFRWLTSDIFYTYNSQFIGFISVFLILGTINWQTGLLFIIVTTAMFIAGRLILPKMNQTERIETDVISSKNGVIIDAIGNFASVKSFHKELKELQTIIVEQQKSHKAARRSYIWGIIFWATMSVFIRHAFWPAVVIMNVSFYVDGMVSIGQLATLLSTALIFSGSIWDMVWQISQISLKFSRINESYEYLFGDHIVREEKSARKESMRPAMKKTLEIRHLSFAYPDKKDSAVLKDFNITIKQGEKIGIVGRSGSGKSTLTKLLLNYYDLPQSRLFVDGKPISGKQLARMIAFVPQDTSLFHRSIADNIAYSVNDEVSREEIVAAAKQAQADEFINDIPEGYDALVGERGIKLSGGQRQRIAIARAILKDAPILVLDEATSALDSESELLIQKALEDLWENKTAIVIAHRLSTIAQLDRIIVLDDGEIVEEGTHRELIAKKGTYAKLWAHQSGGFIEE
jgi:ATP-binding cassette subfamily B protein